MTTFSGSAMIRAGWDLFKKQPWFFIGAFLLAFVVQWLLSVLFTEFGKLGPAAQVVNIVGSIVVGTFYSMGLTHFVLTAHDAPETAKLRDLWHPEPFWKFLAASLLLGLIILAVIAATFLLGMIFWQFAMPVSIVIGLIGLVAVFFFSIMFMFVNYIVIARDFGPVEALKESARITAGHRWQLFGFYILMLLVIILGAICLGVGLLVAIPVVTLATVHAYRTLEQGVSEPVPAA